MKIGYCFVCAIIMLVIITSSCSKKEQVKWPPASNIDDKGLVENIDKEYSARADIIPSGSSRMFRFSSGAEGSTIGDMSKFMIPDDKSDFSVTGSYYTKVRDIEKTGTITDWDYIYKDATKEEIVGWAACVGEGEIFVPKIYFSSELYSNEFIESCYEVQEYDENFFLIKLTPGKKHRLCLKMPSHHILVFTNGNRVSINGHNFIRKSQEWLKE